MTDLLSNDSLSTDSLSTNSLSSDSAVETAPLDADAAPTESRDGTDQGSHGLDTVVELLSGKGTSRSTWTGKALCGGKTHLFFAPPGERRTRRTKREALAMSYCLQCPVMEECRAWARENRESGFWGAENEEQRAAAGFAPKSPNRRAVADAARVARENA